MQVKKLSKPTTQPLQPPTPTLRIGVETSTNYHTAILDSGADTNVLPIAVYNKLCNKAASTTSDILYSFQDVAVASLGVASVPLHINGCIMPTEFQLIDCGSDAHVILEKPWIYKHQCIINYATLRINFTIGVNQYFSNMLDPPATEPSNAPSRLPKPSPILANQANPSTSIPAQTYIKSKSTWVWKPKSNPSLPIPITSTPTTVTTPPSKRSQTSQRQMWIPISILTAQGYYKGKSQIWVPKSKPYQRGAAPIKQQMVPSSPRRPTNQFIWQPKRMPCQQISTQPQPSPPINSTERQQSTALILIPHPSPLTI